MLYVVRHMAFAWLFALGCGSSMHRDDTTPDVDVDEHDEAARRDIAMRPEDVPPKVRVAAAEALEGASRISIVHTSSGQYEAHGIVEGEEQEVTISPSGAIIDVEDVDDIEVDDDDEEEAASATGPADSDG